MLYSGIALVSDPSDKEGGRQAMSINFRKNRVLSQSLPSSAGSKLSDKSGVSRRVIKAIATDRVIKAIAADIAVAIGASPESTSSSKRFHAQ